MKVPAQITTPRVGEQIRYYANQIAGSAAVARAAAPPRSLDLGARQPRFFLTFARRALDIARPTKSALLFTQQVGRGLRLPPGCDNLVEAKKQGASFDKQDCIVLDVTDNSGRHSLVTLNTLFVLPANMDLKGQSVVEAGEKVAAVLERAPSVDLEAARS